MDTNKIAKSRATFFDKDPGSPPTHEPKKSKTALLSMKSWFFNKDPTWICHQPHGFQEHLQLSLVLGVSSWWNFQRRKKWLENPGNYFGFYLEHEKWLEITKHLSIEKLFGFQVAGANDLGVPNTKYLSTDGCFRFQSHVFSCPGYCFEAIAMPTVLATPCPRGPVVISTPVVWPYSGWPGHFEPNLHFSAAISAKGETFHHNIKGW